MPLPNVFFFLFCTFYQYLLLYSISSYNRRKTGTTPYPSRTIDHTVSLAVGVWIIQFYITHSCSCQTHFKHHNYIQNHNNSCQATTNDCETAVVTMAMMILIAITMMLVEWCFMRAENGNGNNNDINDTSCNILSPASMYCTQQHAVCGTKKNRNANRCLLAYIAMFWVSD